MTREEFFYQCMDIIEHWLNGNRKLSDLREVTDKLYNEVTKPHWISVDDELPKKDGKYLIYTKSGQQIIANYECHRGKWHQFNEAFFTPTHWAHLPQSPVLSNSLNIGKDLKGGEG